MIRDVDLAHACRLINHGPTVLVTAAHGGQRNLMAAAWSMPVEFTPPRVAVVVDKSTYTRGLIEASGRFGLSLPCRDIADLAYTVGSVSGRPDDRPGPDKFDAYGIGALPGPVLGLPGVAGAVAWLECRLIPEPHAQGAYDTFFGEVVSAQADDRVFRDGRWRFETADAGLQTLHHLGGGLFALPAATVQATPLPRRG